jgi:hypothetical protein|tara:strand:- start:1 stop:429 length:429 start_codon:yes stop_codon:yes gene_type:complete
MSFLQRTDSGKHRKLTDKQQKFLDVLSTEANGDIKAALKIAGYEDTSYYAVVKSLREEIVDCANTILAHSAPKAAQKLVQVLESDDPIPQVNAKLQAAQTLLDRVGVAKKENINVNHNVSGGIFLLPNKKEVVIEGEYSEDD